MVGRSKKSYSTAETIVQGRLNNFAIGALQGQCKIKEGLSV
jgi:hypothetical protein